MKRLLTITAILVACAAARAAMPGIELVPWGDGFKIPVYLADPGTGDRVLIVEQEGRLVAADRRTSSNRVVVLDLTDRVNYGGEKGLLSVAFHPRFASNGRLFVNYTAGKDNKALETRIAEFKSDRGLSRIDRDSERIVLRFSQPHANHNGGQVLFGPDGKLYIGNGDGGSGNDPQNHAQRMDSLLGKMLRIDVDKRGPDLDYAVPRDNPFRDRKDARPEIWASGFRNPWRFSFDRRTGDLYAGDVGQNNWEEIDLIRKGLNYGWRPMEGFHCTPTINKDCDTKGFEPPLLEYPRSDGVSVTGGYVYRGRQHPALSAIYFYGDYGSSRIWGVRVPALSGKAEPEQLGKASQNIASFAEDRDGELYVVGHAGLISRIIPAR